jgi:hypothetical protein
VTKDLLRLRDWPIISFSFFTLGVFAAQDFGRGFTQAIGLTFLAVALIWSVASLARRWSNAEARGATA